MWMAHVICGRHQVGQADGGALGLSGCFVMRPEDALQVNIFLKNKNSESLPDL